MKIIITTLFGLESPTKGDLLDRGYDKDRITVNDGVVTLEGDFFDVARANMWAKHAERIFFEAGEFDCGSSLEARSCLVIGHLNRNQVICRGKDRDGHSALSIFESALAACERRGILLTFTADLKRVVLIIDRINPVRFSCKDHIILLAKSKIFNKHNNYIQTTMFKLFQEYDDSHYN